MNAMIKNAAVAAIMALTGCTSEKKGLDPGVDQRVTAKLQRAFEEKNMEKVPYLLNFGNLTPENDYYLTFYRTLGEARLFVSDSTSQSKANNKENKNNTATLRWNLQDQKVGQLLRKLQSDKYISLFRQECARGILARTNLLNDNSGDAQMVISKYLNMIVDEGMYAPGLVLYALEKLNGRWSAEQMAIVVQKVIDGHSNGRLNYDQAIAEIEAKAALTDSDHALLASLREAIRENDIYINRLTKFQFSEHAPELSLRTMPSKK